MKDKTKKRIIIIVAASIILDVWILMYYYNNIEPCRMEEYVFIKQYFADYNSKDESRLSSCKGCLWIEAIPKKAYGRAQPSKFFFAWDNELLDLKHKDFIAIKWCETEKGERIRGIWKL